MNIIEFDRWKPSAGDPRKRSTLASAPLRKCMRSWCTGWMGRDICPTDIC